jgi:CRP-like cAMP-binding protein
MALQSANKLLSALPPADYRRILPELRSVHLANGEKLGQCGETRVYFPCSGVCSVRSEMEDGRRIEIAAVGNEGVLGSAAITGDAALKRSFLQITDGFAQSMPLAAFNREMATEGAFSTLVERYSRVFLDAAMQLAACNRLHTLQERYCRWLLITSDRLGRPHVDLTFALLAGALGAKRQELAVITKTLQNLRVLEFEDDQLVIFDRPALERFACDCYLAMRKRLDGASGGFWPPSSDPANAYPSPAIVEAGGARRAEVCAECGVAQETPHRTDRECIRAIDAEMKLLIHRTQRLQAQRKKLFERRLEALHDLVSKSSTRHQAHK